jgi:hypothetical protein
MKPALAAAVGGASVIGAMALVAGLLSGKRSPRVALSGSAADEEAIARMLASENERGSERLWAELIWSQLRSLGTASIWQRITAGQGYGPQGGARPVSSDKPATTATRAYAARFLADLPPSSLPGARRFFEPLQQDRAFAIAESARRKLASGQPLTRQEQRLRLYKSDANDIRRRWASKGHRYIGTVEGVEFWT